LSLSFDHITDDLLVKHLLGEANQEEKQFVEAWISADNGNNNYYQGLKAVWEESKKLAVGSHVDEEAAWTRFKLKISEPKRAGVLKRLDLSWISAAAVYLVVVGIAYLAYSFLHGKPVQTLVVASGTRALTDTLPDGSIVTLNRNSELDYPSRFKGK
jgi:ferric-dicitrate binding protein FerR (iron transport regulator)